MLRAHALATRRARAPPTSLNGPLRRGGRRHGRAAITRSQAAPDPAGGAIPISISYTFPIESEEVGSPCGLTWPRRAARFPFLAARLPSPG
jgi:hypothetical protein